MEIFIFLTKTKDLHLFGKMQILCIFQMDVFIV